MKKDNSGWINSKKFNPKTHNSTPFKVIEKDLWHSVVAANGKTVCNCRNIKDAEFIVKKCNVDIQILQQDKVLQKAYEYLDGEATEGQTTKAEKQMFIQGFLQACGWISER